MFLPCKHSIYIEKRRRAHGENQKKKESWHLESVRTNRAKERKKNKRERKRRKRETKIVNGRGKKLGVPIPLLVVYNN